ncbi:Bicupin oxalate decarboxylase oxidase [Coniophora puteana RWD-64-598 SS2]|uniref:Bicupin oxalate decarboxylase oxidase n=1 Tax=Coniophora puteana (strain RWD-64-598) TaxID=741705 RepID=A0A5M3MHW0_CONPW|nr:Bicupin oxalate decarboxylase oxidase [Coniophora puteana RWD-64-598 SS2]EIW78596.1 Bicupin oxalate decarboxylase oxidase [Coniophora puteana RWD-64-598 SS2]
MTFSTLLTSLLFILRVYSAPAGTGISSAYDSTPTVPYASNDPNYPLWHSGTNPSSKEITGIVVNDGPEAVRGSLGSSVVGPQNVVLDLQNPDALAPPTTDNGDIPFFKWPFSLSHNRLQTGGWARQQNIQQMPVATDLAGVDMRLEPGAIREMHWHKDAEWAYVLKGNLRVSVVTPKGESYVGDVGEGDLWYFPRGFPHSIQATNSTHGAEFLLVFDSGSFSEDDTFLLTDWLAHVPKEVIAKNFQVDISAFDHIPSHELYIFPSSPPPESLSEDEVVPNNTPAPFTFPLSQVNATRHSGGSFKVVDARTFNASTTIAAAEVEVEVGGMRELHWHPTQPEWTYFISGQSRVTAYAASAQANTFDFNPGDIAYIPPSYGHYIENTGNTTLKFLEIFKSDRVQDISLNQWLALTPPNLVKAHLGLDDDTISRLSKIKQEVVGPASGGQEPIGSN